MSQLDILDQKILEIISNNARIPFKDVATVCGVSRAAIHQRVQRLVEAGVVLGSGYYVNPKSLGYSTCTYVGIKLERGSMYKEVAAQLEKIPEIVECLGRGSFVAHTNVELVKEEQYRKIESLLAESVHLAKQSDIGYEELSEILKLIFDE